ncbi:hypothetical protein BN1007_70063 [Klebsiella variicola]|nr:hypothetical protein BN1007_70063 [Klebsiella variicola]
MKKSRFTEEQIVFGLKQWSMLMYYAEND